MKLWVLKLKQPTWDTMKAIVVRAKTEESARKLASTVAYSEGKAAWSNSSKTSCEELSSEGESEIIVKSYAS